VSNIIYIEIKQNIYNHCRKNKNEHQDLSFLIETNNHTSSAEANWKDLYTKTDALFDIYASNEKQRVEILTDFDTLLFKYQA
jgi:hypothetical protein